MFQYEAKVIRIVDGDTMVLDVDLGFHVHVEAIVRLANINAPERVTWTAQGLEDPALQFIQQNTPPGSTVVVDISRSEKYGRYLAVVLFAPGVSDRNEIMRTGRTLNAELLEKGFAQKYEN
jgi:endonuclease YncB( thermonuclease family)